MSETLKFISTYFADVRIYINIVFTDVQKFSSSLVLANSNTDVAY